MRQELQICVEEKSIKVMKDEGAYVINSAEQKSIGTNWIPLHVNDDYLHNSWHGLTATCVEYIPKEIKTFIGNKIKANIYRIQAYDSIMSGYFCIGFADFMLKDKSLIDFTNLFLPITFENNNKI